MVELLELKRASAGSGKTYSLARKFLWYFLTISKASIDDGLDFDQEVDIRHRRLRTPNELRDSLGHILAVTFTNKATHEMQERIVDKLYALSLGPVRVRDKNGVEKYQYPDYLEDFLKDLHGVETLGEIENLEARIQEVVETADKGLHILLEKYTDFQVSTIDSFFQMVLRTFAYETDLNDSYGIELDQDLLVESSIERTFAEVEQDRSSSEVRFWLSLMMERNRRDEKGWNIFNKGGNTPYKILFNAIKKLDSEEFKNVREKLEEYFAETPNMPEIYKALEQKYEGIVAQPYAAMRQAANDFLALRTPDVLAKVKSGNSSLMGHASKILKFKPGSLPKSADSFVALSEEKIKKLVEKNPDYAEDIAPTYLRMVAAMNEWMEVLGSLEYRHWNLYKINFPILGLMSVVMRKRQEFLDENNAIELAETNSLLHRIIGEDDKNAPFIYERLGTRLNHFLIDEFQDTSKLQWINLRPLLQESIGRGNESMLIGDAKQSIYRFRNADSSLIERGVQKDFDYAVYASGSNPTENTNYRSDRVIVEFNNSFFKFLADELTDKGEDATGESKDFNSLYSNVEQGIKHSDRGGYVHVLFHDPEKGDKKSAPREDSEESDSDAAVESMVIARIVDVLSRGFRMGDIGILVDTNSQGVGIVNAITAYNSRLAPGTPKLEFISEQSLLLKSSDAVQLIVTTLEAISNGTDPVVVDEETANKEGRSRAKWQQIRNNFNLYIAEHGDENISEHMADFLDKGTDMVAIEDMLAEMQAVTLPALVEGIIAKFMSAALRSRNATFIAAFQDKVLEYCESHPADIPSFLTWWKTQEKRAAITSPEGMDAVKILTVHKSKGLQYPVVIYPYANDIFKAAPREFKQEWRWVEPQIIEPVVGKLPSYLPIATSNALEQTVHEPIFKKFIEEVTMDYLNKLYVGLTRAERELYIIAKTKAPTKNSSKSGSGSAARQTGMLLQKYFQVPPGTPEYSIGVPYADFQQTLREEEEKKKEKQGEIIEDPDSPRLKKGKEEVRELDDYVVRTTPEYLRFVREDLPEVIDAGEADSFSLFTDEELGVVMEIEEDKDPRSEGNLMHSIMERIETVDDLNRSVEKLYRMGMMNRPMAEHIKRKLHEKITDRKVRSWFDGSYRIINERSIVGNGRGEGFKRPDRIIVGPNGDAVVVDYKFGHYESPEHISQVKHYMWLLRQTGRFSTVAGYVWYVELDRLKKVK